MEREVLRCFDHRNRVKYFKYFMNPNNNFKRAVFTKRKELAKVFTDPEAKREIWSWFIHQRTLNVVWDKV